MSGSADNPFAGPAVDDVAAEPVYTEDGQPLLPPRRAYVAAFSIYIIASVCEIGSLVWQDIVVGRAITAGVLDEQTAQLNDTIVTIGSWAAIIAYWPCVITWSMWVYRAAQNRTLLGPWRSDFTPGAAVWSYFIPFLNLFRPYQITKDIAEGSGANTSTLGPWWGAWILTNVVTNISTRYTVDENAEYTRYLTDHQTAGRIAVVAAILGIFAAIFAMRVANGINAAQLRRMSAPQD